MKNVYHSDIMQLLLLKGKEGMHVAQLSRMVYNLHTNLFDRKLNYNDLHQLIRTYLWRQSKMRRSPFMRVKYGYYAVKPDIAVQLNFCFDDPIEAEMIVKQEHKKPDPKAENPLQMWLFWRRNIYKKSE